MKSPISLFVSVFKYITFAIMRFVLLIFGLLFFGFANPIHGQNRTTNFQFEKMVDAEMKGHSTISFTENQNTQNYDVTYYQLHLEVTPLSTFIIGKVSISFIPNQSLTEIYFDLTDSLQVDSIISNGQLLSFSHAANQISVSHAFTGSVLDSLSIYYHGNPPSNSSAFTTGAHNGTPILWTLSEPYGAMEWWPCKQSLTDKADSLDVFVTAPAGNKVAGNGVLISETMISSQSTLTHWKCRYPIVPYLVAIAVTPYAEISFHSQLSQGSLLVQNYVYPEDSLGSINPLKATDSLLVLFDSLIGYYPFMNEKYGHAQFERGGGMEHQTMSFMTHFGFDLVAHELAHQWFGDKITCGSWQDLWLNEGFATYFTGISTEFLHGDQAFYDWKEKALSVIISEPDGSVFVLDTQDVSRLFDSRLTYRKGAYVLHMLRQKVGDNAFFSGTTNYLNDPDLAYKTALTDDYFEHISQASGQDLSVFKNEWIYGQGFPSFSVQWSQIESTVSCTIFQTTSHPSVGFFHVDIPLLFTNTNGDSLLVKVSPNTTGEEFEIPLDFEVENILIDPNLDLISKGNFAIHEEALNSTLTIYPNPTTSVLNVIPGGLSNRVTGYEIIAINGKTVYNVNELNVQGHLEIDVSTLPQGEYTLVLRQDKGDVIQKFMVIR